MAGYFRRIVLVDADDGGLDDGFAPFDEVAKRRLESLQGFTAFDARLANRKHEFGRSLDDPKEVREPQPVQLELRALGVDHDPTTVFEINNVKIVALLPHAAVKPL